MKRIIVIAYVNLLLMAGCSEVTSPFSLPQHVAKVGLVKVYEGSRLVDTVKNISISLGMSHKTITSLLGSPITGLAEQYQPVSPSIAQEFYRMGGGEICVTFTSAAKTAAAGIQYLSDNFSTVNSNITYWKRKSDLLRAYGRPADDTTGSIALYRKEGVLFSLNKKIDRITNVMILKAQSSVSSGGSSSDESEDSDSSVGSEDSDSSVGSEDSDSSVGSEDCDSSVGSEDSDSSVGSEDSDSSVGSEDSDSSVGSEDSDSSVESEDSDSSVESEDSDSSVESEDDSSIMESE